MPSLDDVPPACRNARPGRSAGALAPVEVPFADDARQRPQGTKYFTPRSLAAESAGRADSPSWPGVRPAASCPRASRCWLTRHFICSRGCAQFLEGVARHGRRAPPAAARAADDAEGAPAAPVPLRLAEEHVVGIGHGGDADAPHLARVAAAHMETSPGRFWPMKPRGAVEHQVAQDVGAVARTAVQAVLEVIDRVVEELVHEAEDHEVAAVVVVVRVAGLRLAGDDVVEARRS